MPGLGPGAKPLAPQSLRAGHPYAADAGPLVVTAPRIVPGATHSGEQVTVSATVTNTSAEGQAADPVAYDLAIALDAPGLTIEPDKAVEPGMLMPGESVTPVWTVSGNSEGLFALAVTATAVIDSVPVSAASSPLTLTIDDTAPTVSLEAPSSWLQSPTAELNWNAGDALSGVTNVEVQTSVSGSPYSTIQNSGDTAGSIPVTVAEGQSVRARVRATDAAGNSSPFVETPGWTVDAEPPTILLQAPARVPYGSPATVVVRAHNIGAPVGAYLRTRQTEPFEPLEGDTFTIPSVARWGKPVIVEAQALDALGRIVRTSAKIATRARRSSLTIKGIKRRGKRLLQATLARRSAGTLAITARCGRKRLRMRHEIEDQSRVLVALRGAEGLCAVRAVFYPAESYRFATANAATRIRL